MSKNKLVGNLMVFEAKVVESFLSALYHHFLPMEERVYPVPTVITQGCDSYLT